MGKLLAELLGYHFARNVATQIVYRRNEHCLHMPTMLGQLPTWDGAQAEKQLRQLLPRIERFLEMGRFHSLLPAGLAHSTALALCDLPRFQALYRSAELVTPATDLRARLEELL